MKSLKSSDYELSASVRGTSTYRVRLWLAEEELGFSCTCPVGEELEFCKHCVAVGLVWWQQNSGELVASDGHPPDEDLRGYLEGLPPETLASLLLEQAAEDDTLRARLLARAGKGAGSSGALRSAIDAVLPVRGFIPYQEMYAYSRAAHEVVDAIEERLHSHATDVIELCEFALVATEDAVGHADDSDGYFGEIFGRLQELHRRACAKAKPDPIALARRLFEWEMRTEWDTFYDAADSYARILGKAGLAEYRRLAGKRWANVRPLGPGEDDGERYRSRFRITRIMEALALQTGDVDALIEVKSRDLAHPNSFLEIARICLEAGREGEALAWAERGMKAFAAQPDPRLWEFVADIYHQQRRHAEAMDIAWALFEAMPGFGRYQDLHSHAKRAKCWDEWRERALHQIRAGSKPTARTRWGPAGDRSSLVQIFLWEKNLPAAWDEAKEGGCTEALWMELARLREKDHPEDALEVYKRWIGPTVARGNNQAYENAVALLERCRRLLVRLGRATDVPGFVAAIRSEFARKRNFAKLIDARQWDAGARSRSSVARKRAVQTCRRRGTRP
ncbi:MAG: SWIM zinc finger family protein [Actinomycetota bacterium]